MRRTFLIASIAFLLFASSALATPDDDRFIAGYASAVLETEFHLPPASVEVSDGVIRVTASGLSADDRDRVVTALKRISRRRTTDTPPGIRSCATWRR